VPSCTRSARRRRTALLCGDDGQRIDARVHLYACLIVGTVIASRSRGYGDCSASFVTCRLVRLFRNLWRALGRRTT
jgi:hypothetical protein